jgi:Putative Flp pilus-assembly TadE/G-like
MREALRSFLRWVRDERGSVLVLVALSTFALLSVSALAIDLGMLYTAHEEAQRIADAAALAGADEYLRNSPSDAVAPGKQWAKNLAAENNVRNMPIDTALVSSTTLVDSTKEMVVQMMPDSFKVRVTVHRPSIGLWFARVFGVNTWGVSATAVAHAVDAGTTSCVKPFVLPDLWDDPTEDTNHDRIMDNGESWNYDPSTDATDRYVRADSVGDPNATGYGSGWRNGNGQGYNNDFGREVTLKYQNPTANSSQSYVPTPSVFLPWDLPDSTGTSQTGASWYKQNIATCNPNQIMLGVPYPIETGNMVGPTFQGIKGLIDQDPGATWSDVGQRVIGSSYGDYWRESPRVVKIAMAAPGQLYDPGKHDVVFNNFVLFFIEGMSNKDNSVTGRLLYFPSGETNGSGTMAGSLVKRLRLVQ